MVKDRTKELELAREEMELAGEIPALVSPFAYEQQINMEDDEDSHAALTSFLLKACDVRQWIIATDEHTNEMKRLQNLLLSSPRSDELIKAELEDRMAAVAALGNQIRTVLTEMAIDTAREEEEASRVTASLRMRKTQHASLSRFFSDTLVKYNTSQLEYRQKCKERIQRQLLIANRYTTDEEIEKMLECGNISVFTEEIVVATQEARQALADIKDRHKEILTLEKNIKELRDLFIEMASLIEMQGEMVDRIESHVHAAAEYIGAAQKKTKKAVVYRETARKKKIVIGVVVAVVLVVIALILYFSLRPAASSSSGSKS